MVGGRAIPQSILIVLLGALGDVCRALPLAMRIKQHWPHVNLTWAIEPKSELIVRGHQAVDDVIVFHRPKGLPAFHRFTRQIGARKFDLVLDMQRHFKSGLTSYSSRAPRRLGFHRRNAKEFNWLFNTEFIDFADDTLPKIFHYQKFGDALGLPSSEKLDFGLRAERESALRIEEILHQESVVQGIEFPEPEKRAVLIIGATWESRHWIAESYAQLIPRLQEQLGLMPIIIGGNDETNFVSRIRDASSGRLPCLNLLGKTSISDLIALLCSARVAVGSDSGPMHLAGAAGLPLVCIMGPTSPVRTGPYAQHHIVLQSAIGCSPCYRRRCPGLQQLCMSSIDSEAVLAAVDKVLRDSRSENSTVEL